MADEITTGAYTRRTIVLPASDPDGVDASSPRKGKHASLKLSVHDYNVHRPNTRGLTVILTHGTSHNKYVWESVINHLLAKPGAKNRFKRFIALDAANHGDSAVLNRDVLPPTVHQPDDSRDIIHVLRALGVREPVLGIGHASGGGALCHAALKNPQAFRVTIFIEPILFPIKDQVDALVKQSLKRRDRWDSKAEFEEFLAKSEDSRDWDPQQVRAYIEFGTYPIKGDDPSSPRALKTPKEQEAATHLAEPAPGVLDLLAQSQGRHHFIWGENSKFTSESDKEAIQATLRHSSTSQVLNGTGHLIPLTHPEILAATMMGRLADLGVPASAVPRFKSSL